MPQNPHLQALGANLVRKLGGVWAGDGGMCLCPAHADHAPSLSIRVGETALLFKCFAGCDTRAVVHAIRRLLPEALETVESQGVTLPVDKHMGWLRSRATDLWHDAGAIVGTLAGQYLYNRQIHLCPPALRFHPRTPLGKGRQVHFRPALIAAVHESANLVAVQRTFLEPGCARRARDLASPRHMLGRPGRGVVMLAPIQDVLGLAEGIETALSAMLLLDIPVWAVLGNERLARVAIPPTVTRLVLLPDNDKGGRIGAIKAREAHAAPGRSIETLWPWGGLNDWNDVLRLEGEREEGRARQAA